jgi:hypothetical protein
MLLTELPARSHGRESPSGGELRLPPAVKKLALGVVWATHPRLVLFGGRWRDDLPLVLLAVRFIVRTDTVTPVLDQACE